MIDIFEQVTPVKPDMLFRRNDENDVRLGETVLTDAAQYATANVVLLGCPQDEGVQRNKGRVGAKDAPDAIRRCLYRYATIAGLHFFDLGNTIIQTTLEATHDSHRDIVRQVLHDGKTLVILGGGNDISYPDCSALAMESDSDILAFNIDAHFDVRADEPRNSGTPYRQLLEEGHIKGEHFFEIGNQDFANSAIYKKYLVDKGVMIVPILALWTHGLNHIFELMTIKANVPIFWGLDMDVVRAADAPGVSAVNPAGMRGEDFVRIASKAGDDPHTKILEITEVNPRYDIDERTCRLAAAAIWHFLAAVARNN
ncbi:MAG: formimidoylglutamase [Anaerolineae bacterium]|nr:formimidoylglutamase [Anaerolineae bacterium]MDQ7037442.1 formimidoylglutamase [Anaerolineae bacterium]